MFPSLVQHGSSLYMCSIVYTLGTMSDLNFNFQCSTCLHMCLVGTVASRYMCYVSAQSYIFDLYSYFYDEPRMNKKLFRNACYHVILRCHTTAYICRCCFYEYFKQKKKRKMQVRENRCAKHFHTFESLLIAIFFQFSITNLSVDAASTLICNKNLLSSAHGSHHTSAVGRCHWISHTYNFLRTTFMASAYVVLYQHSELRTTRKCLINFCI